jgi:2-(1,2-epoxy-1,2-dihydrophenyl)acetyl-CoA isomerase
MGLVNGVVDQEQLVPTVQELASRLAAGPTAAYAAIKQSIAYAASADLQSSLAKEDELQTAMGRTEDHRNSTAAFVAKQKPTFTGR